MVVSAPDLIRRLNVRMSGPADAPPMVFAHGFGCDQGMWRLVAPAFADRFRVITFDHVGSGGSDPAAYDPVRYSSLEGYAADVVDLLRALDLHDVVFVGHSVSAMIGVLAEITESDRFDRLVLVGPSPCYIDDADYVGGFAREDIDGLLDALKSNYLGWSMQMAPAIMGNADRPHLGQELTESFCRMDPEIADRFARATFLSDNRADLPRVRTPTLVLQCSQDVVAPFEVGRFVADAIPDAELVVLEATGHCPHLSAPEATITAIADRVDARRAADASS
jgi:sigma-B regulation protein RsbQ